MAKLSFKYTNKLIHDLMKLHKTPAGSQITLRFIYNGIELSGTSEAIDSICRTDRPKWHKALPIDISGGQRRNSSTRSQGSKGQEHRKNLQPIKLVC